MAIAPDFLTWDGDGGDNLPRRPSTDDFGGDAKQDDADFPPDDQTMPTAAGWNQQAKQGAALAKVVSACKLEVQFSGGAPSVGYTAARSTPITFTPTDNGTGDTTVSWPADTFPPETISPSGLTLFSNGTAPVIGHAQKTVNGVRVRTFIWSAGSWVATDIQWTLHIN